MPRSYAIYDVFTGEQLKGNPLAVVFDAQGLDDAAMQAIALEFNLSETVFIRPAEARGHAASLRIFTPGRELPFAGHPTVGAAIALSEAGAGWPLPELDRVMVLEEKVGPVRCAVRHRPGEPSFAEFDLPRRSAQLACDVEREALADCLGLAPSQIGFENHRPTLWSAGVPYLLVPVHDLAACGEIVFDTARFRTLAPRIDGSLPGLYAYCRGGVHHLANLHARMFAADMGLVEDPATGSAVAALSGAIHHFDALLDGHHALVIEQGVEMGRASLLHLHIDVAAGAISAARIGGQAVRIATGELHL